MGDTIRVTAPDVVLEGLIVRDSGTSLKDQNAGIYIYPGAHRAVVRKNDLTYNLFGLWIEKANDVRVEHNTITGLRDVNSSQRGNGVQLYNTTGARIEGNHISFVRDALYVDVSHHAIFRGNKLLIGVALFIVNGTIVGNLASDNLLYVIPVLSTLAIVPIAFYNGEKGKDIKLFFYIFYPLHLTLLFVISLFIR